jgi:hypothetical protein
MKTSFQKALGITFVSLLLGQVFHLILHQKYAFKGKLVSNFFIFMKNTPVESFKHVYTGSVRKEILHSWTCPPVVTRLLANAINDNLPVKWEVGFSSKLLHDVFLMLTKPALYLADHASS